MITSYDAGKTGQMDVEARACQSKGTSTNAIYEMVARVLRKQHPGGGVLVDVGCGNGNLWPFVSHYCDRYIGVDAVRYNGFPSDAELILHNLDTPEVPLADAFADVVISVETIEHLENPRAFMRELVRLTKPEGLAIVTTPNQLSLLSKLTLLLKNQFNAFQEAPGLYPAHLTALLEIDLTRIATECGLTNVAINYSDQGRIPFTPWHWPKSLGFCGQAFSDNILCSGLKSKV
jgi:2-polyprenyl-3-methyl-5-hydroxy-6-metoxy-1,4-benzoquinol methylase